MRAMLGVKLEQVNAKLGHAAGGSQPCSFQLRVFVLGFLQNGDVGIGVFPEVEKLQVGGASFRTIALEA